jgi:hypothetical protein
LEELAASRWSWANEVPLAEFAKEVLWPELALRGKLEVLDDPGGSTSWFGPRLSHVPLHSCGVRLERGGPRQAGAASPPRAACAALATAEEWV